MKEVKENENSKNITQNGNSTEIFDKLIELQSLLKKESTVKEICKKKLFI